MSDQAQTRAVKTYRARQASRGISRFEIQAPEADRALIRALARCLAEDGPDAAQARTTIQQIVSGEPPRRGGILHSLLHSPLAGTDLIPDRVRSDGRTVEL